LSIDAFDLSRGCSLRNPFQSSTTGDNSTSATLPNVVSYRVKGTHWDSEFVIRTGMAAFQQYQKSYSFEMNSCGYLDECGIYKQVCLPVFDIHWIGRVEITYYGMSSRGTEPFQCESYIFYTLLLPKLIAFTQNILERFSIMIISRSIGKC